VTKVQVIRIKQNLFTLADEERHHFMKMKMTRVSKQKLLQIPCI